MTAIKLFGCIVWMLLLNIAYGQAPRFTQADTLRGSITPQRDWWDLTYYRLKVSILNPAEKRIAGVNEIHYTVLNPGKFLQIDLQPPLVLERAEQDGQVLQVTQQGRNAYFIELQKNQPKGSKQVLAIRYSGIPKEALNPPWDGGFSWDTAEDESPFIATSCQGLGASVWWPCKDHGYDEPDSMSISVTLPEQLTDVSNGRLRKVINHGDGSHTMEWFVANPINNYGVNVNIAQYSHFSDTFPGEKGLLSLDYYVLPQNLDEAKVHFQQVKSMLTAFEHWFGPYPFYEDGYKLVESSHLGMEHQSATAYGNHYQNGYLGGDLSGTGWGLKWDYIIIHESGHEWFANNITTNDIADMWIHEGFTMYSEALFVEYHYGKKAADEYVQGIRNNISNDKPLIGSYGVNQEGSGDMYNKGANLLHTIRQIINDDSVFRMILRGLNKDFYHQTVDSKDVEAYFSKHSGKDLSKIFDQYLRTTNIPVLEYKIAGNKLSYRWSNCIKGFSMPVKLLLPEKAKIWITPETNWQEKTLPEWNEKYIPLVDKNFYITVKKID